MVFRRPFKGSDHPRQASRRSDAGQESGVALFMVLSSMTILALLVTEFTYVAQVNSRMAFDSLDQVKAHYLAKGGLKLSLIRIRAYQNLKALAANAGGGAAGGMIPKGLLEKIWNFPFFYPIPTNLPGMTPSEKEQIEKFSKSAAIEGRFSANIESESNKYNLNSVLAPFVPTPSPTATSTGAPSGGSAGGGAAQPGQAGQPTPAPTSTFNPAAAQEALATYVTQILNNKLESDEDFAADYRDLKVDEFVDNLISWVDPAHQRRSAPPSNFNPKGGPFYSVSELRMIPPVDDQIFEVLAPNFTVSAVPGLNVNTVKDMTLKAFFPQMVDEEVKEFFKFRDSTEADNSFKTEEDFFTYLKTHVAAFRGSDTEMDSLKAELKKRNVRIVTDESHFKVTILATVNQASRLIEAHVMVVPQKKSGAAAPVPVQGQPSSPGGATAPAAPTDSGLRITSMRIL